MALARTTSRRRYRVSVLVLAAVTFLTLDLRGFGPIGTVQQDARNALSPIRSRLDSIFEPITSRLGGVGANKQLEKENEDLRKQLDEARQQQLRDEADALNYRLLRDLVGLRDELQIPVVFGRVTYDRPGNFNANTVEIDRGSNSGLKKNQPVMTQAGLVGRIEKEPDRDRAVVRLLSDPSSSVAVRVGETKVMTARGIGKANELELVSSLDSSTEGVTTKEVGQLVTTNGGPVFPKDLVVGRIVDTPDGIRVQLSADLSSLDFVAVLQYQAPS